jgi:hypothetical protein
MPIECAMQNRLLSHHVGRDSRALWKVMAFGPPRNMFMLHKECSVGVAGIAHSTQCAFELSDRQKKDMRGTRFPASAHERSSPCLRHSPLKQFCHSLKKVHINQSKTDGGRGFFSRAMLVPFHANDDMTLL